VTVGNPELVQNTQIDLQVNMHIKSAECTCD